MRRGGVRVLRESGDKSHALQNDARPQKGPSAMPRYPRVELRLLGSPLRGFGGWGSPVPRVARRRAARVAPPWADLGVSLRDGVGGVRVRGWQRFLNGCDTATGGLPPIPRAGVTTGFPNCGSASGQYAGAPTRPGGSRRLGVSVPPGGRQSARQEAGGPRSGGLTWVCSSLLRARDGTSSDGSLPGSRT